MKKVFKTLKERQEQLENQKMEQQQQQIEQQKQIAEAQMQQATQLQQEKIAHDDYQNELDRLNKIQIAMINAESKAGPLSDVDTSGTADVLEIDKLLNEQSKAQSDYRAKMADIDSKSKLAAQKLQVEREKLQVARENQANDLAIAKENAKGRAKKSK
jgi:stress response protein YsnF